MSDDFHGKGFSTNPIEGEEAASHRHMFNEVSENWKPIKGAVVLFKAVVIFQNIVRVGGPVLVVLVAAGMWAAAQGWV